MSSFTKSSYTSGHDHVYAVYGPDIVYRMMNTRGGSTALFNRVLFFDEPLDNNKQFLSDAEGLYEEIVSQTDTVHGCPCSRDISSLHRKQPCNRVWEIYLLPFPMPEMRKEIYTRIIL